MAGTMRAWVQRAFGGPEVRRLEEMPIPVAARDEVLIRVRACALNRLDLLQRVERVIPDMTLPHIAGMDFVGDVVSAGGEEGEWLVGTTVVVDPVVTCGTCDRCRSGLAAYCRSFRTCGSSRPGGFADYVAVPARNCIPVALDHIGQDELACVPVASVTAWHGLLTAGRLQAGEAVVIPGAGSGLGVAGIQIAKAHSAFVVTTVAGPAKLEAARATGADIVIDRLAGDWVAAARDAVGGAGADLVWDHVGGGFLQQAIDACRLNGRVVMSGTTAGNHSCIINTSLFHWGKSIIGHGGYTAAEMRATIAAYCAGELRVLIDSRWPFERLPEAEARLGSDAFFGKVLLCL